MEYVLGLWKLEYFSRLLDLDQMYHDFSQSYIQYELIGFTIEAMTILELDL